MSNTFMAASTWRTVDVIFPRGVSFLFQTIVVYLYGFEALAFYLWGNSTVSLVTSFVPDPHSYILLRSDEKSALKYTKLLGLPLLVKLGIVSLIFYILYLSSSFTHYKLQELLSILIFSFSEFLWAVLGVLSVATGKTKVVAICGVIVRSILLLIVIILAYFKVNVWIIFFVFGMGVTFTAAYLGKFGFLSFNLYRRSMLYARISFVRYSLWNQLSSMYTALLLQVPFVLLGYNARVSESEIGIIGYVVRVFNILLQPLQIIQAIIIRGINKNYSEINKVVKYIYIVTRCMGVVAISIGSVLFLIGINIGVEEYVLVVSSALIVGIGASIFYRIEFVYLLANEVDLRKYSKTRLPSLYALLLISYAVAYFWNVPLVFGVAIILTWLVTVLTWKQFSSFRHRNFFQKCNGAKRE